MSTSRTTDAVIGARYWITPAACAVTSGGHRPDLDRHHCRVCGVRLDGAA